MKPRWPLATSSWRSSIERICSDRVSGTPSSLAARGATLYLSSASGRVAATLNGTLSGRSPSSAGLPISRIRSR